MNPPIWQRLRTDNGWVLRLISADGTVLMLSGGHTQKNAVNEVASQVILAVDCIPDKTDINDLFQEIDMRTHREPVEWFVAACRDCLAVTVSFRKYDERAVWVGAHRVDTGHTVDMFTQVR